MKAYFILSVACLVSVFEKYVNPLDRRFLFSFLLANIINYRVTNMGHMIVNDRGGRVSIAVPTRPDDSTVLQLGHGHTTKMGDKGVKIVLCSVSQGARELAEMAPTRCAIECVVEIMIQFDQRSQLTKMVVHLLNKHF